MVLQNVSRLFKGIRFVLATKIFYSMHELTECWCFSLRESMEIKNLTALAFLSRSLRWESTCKRPNKSAVIHAEQANGLKTLHDILIP